MPPSHVVVLGGTRAGVQAAHRLAAAGLQVTLLESSPFLGHDLPANASRRMSATSDLLEAMRDPAITVITQAVLQRAGREKGRLRLQVEAGPRYVDPTRCTACGECVQVCPVEPKHLHDGSRRKAIYLEPPDRAVPNIYVIEKRGVAPCTHTCPGGIHVQGYVALIAQGKFRQAHDLIREAIPFPGICGRVCYHPCEGQCSRRDLDEAVAVRPLKRFVADHVGPEGLGWEAAPPDPTLPPVAVVGAGPAGLTTAWALARQGVRVTVLEALPVPGGMMAVGIPPYRLPRDELRREIAALTAMGIDLRLNTALGRDVTLEELRKEYGAVFLGLGAHRSRRPGVPGEDLAGVVQAIDLLRAVNLALEGGVEEATLPGHLQRQGIPLPRRASVVGGGNTAVDAARTLLRLGVEEVRILYRRSRSEMPALPEEVTAAEEEGISLEVLATPVRILGQDGRVQAVEAVRIELGEPDESGRRRPVPIPGSEFLLETDMVVLAIGQQADLAGLPEALREDGHLKVDPETGQTPLEGVFAGGDIVRVASVIEAIGAGKRAAESILRYLRGEALPAPVWDGRPLARWSAEDLEGRVRRTRQQPPTLQPQGRRAGFAEVERAFTAEQAVAEASRCLACGVCSECMECVAVCKPQAIVHTARPRHLTLEADALLLADDRYALPFTEGVYRLGQDTAAAINALLGTLAPSRRPAGRRGVPAEGSPPERLGVFICRCGGQIEHLPPDALSQLPGVVRVEQVEFACLPEGLDFLKKRTAGLDGAVLGACSCCNLEQTCYSCTSQRLRCREGLGVWADLEGALPAGAWEHVNIREHGVWSHPDASALVEETLTAAVARLRTGPAVPLVARVDAARCRACGTCQKLCLAEAIRVEVGADGRAVARVEEARCLACGTCAAHCPTGAVLAGRVSDRQVEATAEALLAGAEGRVLVLTCNWGGHSGAEVVGMRRQSLPAGVRVMRLPCLGRLSAGLLLRLLEQGAAGVLLAGCSQEGCRFEFGRPQAQEALAQARALADLLGLDPQRLALADVPAGDGRAFLRAVREMAAQVQPAGLPCGMDARSRGNS